MKTFICCRAGASLGSNSKHQASILGQINGFNWKLWDFRAHDPSFGLIFISQDHWGLNQLELVLALFFRACSPALILIFSLSSFFFSFSLKKKKSRPWKQKVRCTNLYSRWSRVTSSSSSSSSSSTRDAAALPRDFLRRRHLLFPAG